MKTRTLCLVLAVVLCLTVLSVGAAAREEREPEELTALPARTLPPIATAIPVPVEPVRPIFTEWPIFTSLPIFTELPRPIRTPEPVETAEPVPVPTGTPAPAEPTPEPWIPIIVEPTPWPPFMPLTPPPQQYHVETGLRGDVNNDKVTDARDAAAILQQLVGLPVPVWFYYDTAADANNDGRVGLADISYILTEPAPEELGTWEVKEPIMVSYKPVVYLYPAETTDVTVTLGNEDALTVVYPAYEDGWRVTAAPDGTLTGENGREYYSLYYEADIDAPKDDGTGFCVPRAELVSFLEEKLAALGLTDREAEEMIVYWLPLMQQHPYVYVRFALGGDVDELMPLTIRPAPDSVLRVWMVWQGLDEPLEIEAQTLPAFEREGFAVVEWGGVPLPAGTLK